VRLKAFVVGCIIVLVASNVSTYLNILIWLNEIGVHILFYSAIQVCRFFVFILKLCQNDNIQFADIICRLCLRLHFTIQIYTQTFLCIYSKVSQ